MTDRDDELEQMKRIDARAGAAALFGYVLVPAKSSINTAVMQAPDGSRIVVARASDGHYTFFAVDGSGDGGSILDLAMRHGAANLGHARKAVRPLLGAPLPAPFAAKPLQPIERDLASVRAAWESFALITDGTHPILQARSLSPTIVGHPRFQGRIAAAGDAVAFAHPAADGSGVVGFDLKTRDGKSRFSRGGQKTGFVSAITARDEALCFTEAPLDALSYAQLHGLETTRFIALGGQPSPHQLKLIERAVQKLPAGATAIAALDADPAGDVLTEVLAKVFHAVKRTDLAWRDHRPTAGKDWNDVLQMKHSGRPPPPPGPG